jgi:hypothetical protein
MGSERWVVLGVAPVRAAWFTELARWSTAGVVPVEFVKCLSTDEVTTRLRSGRAFSALLADARAPGLDRDLLADATQRGCAAVVVGDPATTASTFEAASLPEGFDRAELLAVLHQHARPVDEVTGGRGSPVTSVGPWRGRLVGVTGVPGSGCSTVAMALAQGLGRDPRHQGNVALADLALDADLGVLHDAREVVPALQELVEGHRGRSLGPNEVRSMLFADRARGYDLLLGLRRHRDWTALRPRAVAAAVDGLGQAYRLVVAEIDPDLEGEADTGSADVEERNALARTVVERADVLVVVSRPGVQGVHRLGRAITGLLEAGLPSERVQPVIVGGPKRRRGRAEVTRALAALTVLPDGSAGCASPVYVATRSRLDQTLHDALPLPDALGRPVVRAVVAALERVEPRRRDTNAPVPVAPGSVGRWADAEETTG